MYAIFCAVSPTTYVAECIYLFRLPWQVPLLCDIQSVILAQPDYFLNLWISVIEKSFPPSA
jgi:hypothetical protein